MKRIIPLVLVSCSYATHAQDTNEQQVRALWQQHSFTEAKTLLAPQVTKKTQDTFLIAALGRTELDLGNAVDAEEWLAKAIKIQPENAEYQFWYGRASCDAAQQASMFSALSLAKRCVKAFETATKLAPENSEYLQALAKYYAQAPSMAGGDKAQAMALSKQLQQKAPLKGKLLELELLLAQDDYTAADSLIAHSIELQNRPEPYFLKGVRAALKRDYQAAITEFQTASEQIAVDEEASRSRLLSLYQLGRATVSGKISYPQGIDALERFLAAERLPEFHDWAKFRLGQLYLATEQRPKAEALLLPLQTSTKDEKLKIEIKKAL